LSQLQKSFRNPPRPSATPPREGNPRDYGTSCYNPLLGGVREAGGGSEVDANRFLQLSSCFVLDSGFSVIYPELKTFRNTLRKCSFSETFLKQFRDAERLEVNGDFEQAAADYENILRYGNFMSEVDKAFGTSRGAQRPPSEMSRWAVRSARGSCPPTDRPNFVSPFSAAEKGFAQFALSRTLKKGGNTEEALSAYQQVIEDYSEAFSSEGLNLKLIAQDEIIRLEEKNDGDAISAFRKSLQLLREIYDGQWDISEGEYEYFTDRLREFLDVRMRLAGIKQQDEWKTFRAVIRNDRQLRETAALVSSNAANIKSDSVSSIRSGNSWIYYKRTKSARAGLIVAAEIKDSGEMNRCFAEMLKSRGISPEMMVQIVNSDGAILMTSGNPGRLSHSVIMNLRSGMFGAGRQMRVYNERTGQIEAISKRHMLFNLVLIGCLFVIVLASGLVSLKITLKEAELSRLKTNFISSVSHEMRLPLSTIKTANEMFRADKIANEAQARKYHEYIASEANRLERLVNNVLDFSRIDAGRKKYKFQYCSLSDAVREAVDSMRVYLEQGGFAVEERIEPEIFAMIDRDAVTQATLNLLDNARKFSAENKFIRITLFRDKAHMVVEVEDKGIGIAKDKSEKIFDRFYRIEDEMTRQTKGAGLGLALVKQTMLAHHGSVKVRGIEGQGSVFSLLFPLE